MNHRLLIPICIAYLLCSGTATFAQISLKIPVISNASAGQVLQLPITVTRFDSIVAFQFVLRWDPAVVQFIGVDGFNLPGFDAADIGTTHALDSGFVRIVWEFYTPSGTSLPDGSSICRLNLKVVGPVNSGTSILFTEIPPLTYFEFSKANNQVISLQNAQIFNGFVAIGYVIVQTLHPQHDFRLQAFPNPFSTQLHIRFFLNHPDDIQISLVDTTGKVLSSEHMQLPVGEHLISYEMPMLPAFRQCYLIVSNQKIHQTVFLAAHN